MQLSECLSKKQHWLLLVKGDDKQKAKGKHWFVDTGATTTTRSLGEVCILIK